jgi:hypothetical protein
MANRTGTYVAFDGLGQTDPTKSDFRFYSTLQAWDAHKHIDFQFVNSHDKTDAVRDSSKRATLEARIQERLRASKNMLVILSTQTRKSGSMLVFEIEQAVDTYKLPLICVYPGYRVVRNADQLSARWPTALSTRIASSTAKAIHIAFAQKPILEAIGQFAINDKMPSSSKSCYVAEAYRKWGLLNVHEQEGSNFTS